MGENVGAYGVELGSYAALSSASKDARIKVLVLDSVPSNLMSWGCVSDDDVGVSNAVLLLWLVWLHGFIFLDVMKQTLLRAGENS